jgi:hypothetical protein
MRKTTNPYHLVEIQLGIKKTFLTNPTATYRLNRLPWIEVRSFGGGGGTAVLFTNT